VNAIVHAHIHTYVCTPERINLPVMATSTSFCCVLSTIWIYFVIKVTDNEIKML